MFYTIKGKGQVHKSCYDRVTKSLDSPWRGTIIDSIDEKGSCCICCSKIGYQAFQLTSDPELGQMARVMVDRGQGRYFYVDQGTDGATVWSPESDDELLGVGIVTVTPGGVVYD